MSRDNNDSIGRAIDAAGVVPVVAVDSVAEAVNVASALSEGGLPIIEITLRTPAATAAISAVRKEVPDVVVGAGTILNVADIDRATEAGAHFGVAPGFTLDTAARAIELDLPFLPGVASASEVTAAIAAGFLRLKFFPAEALGGVATLKSLMGPFGHTGVTFVPTGGIDLSRAAEYWRQPFVAAVGGSWLVPEVAIRDRDWSAITELARASVVERAANTN